MTTAIPPDFKSVFESAPDLYLVLTPALTIIAASDSYLQATMTIRELIIGQDLFEVFPDNPNDAHATGVSNLSASLNYVLQSKLEHVMAVQKYDIRKPDGTFEVRYWSPRNKPVIASTGEIDCIIHRVEDVTAYIKTKQLLKERDLELQKTQIEIIDSAKKIQHINSKLLSEIEERKKLEHQLQLLNTQLEEKVKTKTEELNGIFEHITDAFVAIDKDWCYTYVNKTAGKLLNRNPQSLIGKNIWIEFPEGINQPFHTAYRDVMASQRYGYLEEYFPPWDIWLENHIYPTPEGLSIFFRDVTEKKKAEQKIEYEKNLSQAIINSLPGAFYMADVNGHLLQWNKNFEMVSGYSAKEISNMRVRDFVSTDDKQALIQRKKHVITHGMGDIETQLLTKQKEKIPFYFNSLLFNYNHAPCILGIGINISEQKKAQEKIYILNEEILKSEKKFRGLIENSNDIVALLNRDLKVIYRSPSAARISGWTDEEVNKKGKENELHPEDQLKLKLYLEEVLAKPGKPIPVEFRTKHKQGHYLFLEGVMINMLNDESIKGIIFNLQDVTERKKRELELRNANFRFELIAKATNDALWELNFTTGELWGNKAHQEIYGLTLSDPMPTEEDWKKRIHPKERNKVVELQAANLASNKRVFTSDYHFLNANNEYRNIHVRCYILRDLEGNPLRMMGSMMDITKQKFAEQELAKSENHLRTILETEPECVKLINTDGELINMNRAGLAMLEADNLEQVKKIGLLNIVAPAYRKAFAELNNKVFANIPGKLEFEIIGIKGTHRWLETNAVPFKNDEGKISSLLSITRDITERKKAEQELATSEAFNRGVLASLSSHIAVINNAGVIITVNKAWDDFAKTSGDITLARTSQGTNYFDVCKKAMLNGDEYAALTLRGIQSVFDKKTKVFELEYPCHSPTEQRWFILRAMNFESDTPKVVVVHQDITTRKKAEQELIASEERFRTLYEENPLMNFTVDTAGTILTANKQGAIELGYAIGELNNQSVLQLFHPEDHQGVLLQIRECIANPNKSFSWVIPKVTKQGNTIWVSETGTALLDKNGNYSVIIVCENITIRRKAEQELEKSETKYRQLVETAQEGIWMINEQNETDFVNEKMASMLGYSREQMLGKHLFDFMDAEGKLLATKNIERRKQGIIEQHDFAFKTAEGKTIWTIIETNPIIKDGKHAGALAMVSNITERRKAEDDLQIMNEQLRNLTAHLHTIRETERTAIAREIHDVLGQQMTAFKYDISWLKKKRNRDENELQTKIASMNNAVDETIQVIRKISSELRPRILDDLGLNAAIEWYANEFEKNTAIKCVINSTIEGIIFDKKISITIYRIMQESLTNVARHSKASQVEINISIEQQLLTLEVKDNGKGFLSTAKEKLKSLGLFGMYERALMIGGTLDVNAAKEKGTAVILKVPLTV